VTDTLTAQGADQTAIGVCSDVAGHTKSASVAGINIDKTPPAITLVSRLPAANAHGWNDTNVVVSWSCADGLSGPVDSTVTDTRAAEGANQTANGICADLAGNTTMAGVAGINIDLTPPTIAFVSRVPQPNALGWNNAAVVVNWSCADGLSGPVDSSVTDARTAEGANQTANGVCADLAGNTTAASVAGINIDKTAPSLACPAAPAVLWPANHKLVPVAVQLSFIDLLSGTGSDPIVTARSSEPDNGLGDGDTAGDIVGFVDGGTAGALRAERSGQSAGRTYTLEYRGTDRAGNEGTCSAVVTVPHDRGGRK
jgi:hypothetical protein